MTLPPSPHRFNGLRVYVMRAYQVAGTAAALCMAAGSGAKAEDGKTTPLDVKVGDRVLFSKYGGTEVNIDGVEPMTSVVEQSIKQRKDGQTDGGYADKIVSNAPVTEDNFFMVPKVVE